MNKTRPSCWEWLLFRWLLRIFSCLYWLLFVFSPTCIFFSLYMACWEFCVVESNESFPCICVGYISDLFYEWSKTDINHLPQEQYAVSYCILDAFGVFSPACFFSCFLAPVTFLLFFLTANGRNKPLITRPTCSRWSLLSCLRSIFFFLNVGSCRRYYCLL